jgi:hypothetical protein
LGDTVGICKQAREQVVMSEPKSIGPLILPAEKVIQGAIPLGLMQPSLPSRLARMPHERHIKGEIKQIRIKNFSLDGSSHQKETRPSPRYAP